MICESTCYVQTKPQWLFSDIALWMNQPIYNSGLKLIYSSGVWMEAIFLLLFKSSQYFLACSPISECKSCFLFRRLMYRRTIGALHNSRSVTKPYCESLQTFSLFVQDAFILSFVNFAPLMDSYLQSTSTLLCHMDRQ